MDSPAPKYRHDAFISYSRKDADFAKALETALENFQTPRDLPIRQHHLDIFRDEADFVGTAYHESIEHHLQKSATLIVICSPDAAQSKYVEDEIRRFVGADPDRRHKIIPLLYRGIPNNKTTPGQEKEKAFPAALCEFLEMPLGIDYRGFDPKKHKPNRGTYENSWYAALANICGVGRAEIEERDRRRRNRIRRLQVGAVSAVIVVLLIALIITMTSRQQAVREQHIAESGRLSANALNVLSIDPQLSLLLALEAAMLSYSNDGTVSVEAQDAIHRALPRSREQLRMSHAGFVTALAFSPDRRVLATADDTGARLWDTVNGSQLPFRLDGVGAVVSLAFSPDGSKLATAGKDHTAKLWDVASGRELRTFRGHRSYLLSVALSPDGTRLATTSHDTTAKVWDLASGQEVKTLTGHTKDVNTIAFSPDGKLLATGGGDGTARIWDAVSGRKLHELSSEEDVSGVAFSPDGKRLATVDSVATTVRIWDVVSGRQLSSFGHHASGVLAVAYSPDGSRLVTGSDDGTARLWNSASGKELVAFTGHTEAVVSVAFSSDGEHIATGSEDRTARMWEIEEPFESPPLVGHASTINHVAFSPDGKRIATASDDNTTRIWEATTGRELFAVTQGGAVKSVAFSPDGRRFATANSDGTGRILDAASGAEQINLIGHRAEVTSIVFSRDGRRLATGSRDKTAKIWDAASGKELGTIHSDVGEIEAIDLNGNATLAAIAFLLDVEANSGASAQVWDLRSGRALTNLDGDHVCVNQVVFNRDGARIVTTGGTAPFLVKVWDTASGRKLLTLSGHTGGVLTAAFSPDGNTLATGGDDSTIKIWNPLNGHDLFTLFTPDVHVESLAFSPGSEVLASANSDRMVRLYAMNPKDLVLLAASRLSRALTVDECRHYLHRDDCSEAASSRLVAGKELVKTGRVGDALATFRRAFAAGKVADPESAAKLLLGELRLSEARERAHVGDFIGATAALRAAINLEPRLTSEPDRLVAFWVAMAQVKKAKQLAAASKFAEAITLLRQAVALDPNNEAAYLALASALKNTDEYGKAAEAMRKALEILPTSSNTIDLADSLRLNKEYPEAIALLNRAIAENPRSERAHRILGLVFLATGDSERALNQFTSAIAIKPTTYAYREMAGIYESRKDFTHALDNLQKAKEVDRNYVPVYEDASRIYLEELGEFEAAYRELSVAYALTPDAAGLKANYVEVCLTARKFQEAIDTANELLESPVLLQELNASDQLAVRFIKVAALLLSGHPEQASKARQELIAYFRRLPAFKHTWSYAGTRRFLTNYTMDEDKRFTLLQLLETLENKAGRAR